jgi:predicted metal-dependent hydrolase
VAKPRNAPRDVPQADVIHREQDGFRIQIISSTRRRKTISARLLNWYTLEVRAPAHLSPDALNQAVDDLVRRMLAKRARLQHYVSDAELERRAQRLNQEHFGGRLAWRSIRFVSNQRARFGSCTPSHGSIRISDRLAAVPDFVLDYVIVHELAHLEVPDHSSRFWEAVYGYGMTERARGYLMALSQRDELDDTVEHDASSDISG